MGGRRSRIRFRRPPAGTSHDKVCSGGGLWWIRRRILECCRSRFMAEWRRRIGRWGRSEAEGRCWRLSLETKVPGEFGVERRRYGRAWGRPG